MSGRYHTRKRKKKQIRRKLILLLVLLAAAAILAAVAYRLLDGRDIFGEDEFGDSAYGVVEIGGVRCRAKTRIKTYLFMGVDASGKAETQEEYDGTGQCDVLELVVIDQNADTYATLPINRDTITEVKSLRSDGSYIGTSEIQISLAHANGDGMEISCENTVDAVSNLLYGQTIDGYAALNMDSVSIINGMVGGVTVTVEDDFSQVDPSLKMGETITLTDSQALSFVRGRSSVGDGTNENRMKRQQQYLDSLRPILEEKAAADEGFVLDLYDALGDYMVTSLTGKDCSKLAKAMLSNEYLGEFQIEGTSAVGRLDYKEFTVDEDSLRDVVIDLFYERL